MLLIGAFLLKVCHCYWLFKFSKLDVWFFASWVHLTWLFVCTIVDCYILVSFPLFYSPFSLLGSACFPWSMDGRGMIMTISMLYCREGRWKTGWWCTGLSELKYMISCPICYYISSISLKLLLNDQAPVAGVVVMACNRADYLDRTIKSILK